MPEYLAPGVYVEEQNLGPVPIEGVSTSTAGFVGMTVRGPVVGFPVLVTSSLEFQRNFGGYLQPGPYSYLPYSVDAFFNNGGERLYIARIVSATASFASATTHGGMVTRLSNSTIIDPVAQRKLLTTTSVRGIQKGTKLLLRMLKEGIARDSVVLTVQSIDTNGLITVDAEISTTSDTVFDPRYTTVFTDVDAPDANTGLLVPALGTPGVGMPASFIIAAKDKGSWGNGLNIQAVHESAARTQMDAFVSGAAGANKIRVKSPLGFYRKAWVEIDQGDTKRYLRVTEVNGTVLTLSGNALAAADVVPQAPRTATLVSSCEFRLTVSYDGVTEVFGGLTLENVPGRYYVDQMAGSNLISVPAPAAGALTHPFLFPSGDDGSGITFDLSGSDGAAVPTDADYRGQDGDPGQKSGIRALEDIEEISIIAAPGATSQQVQQDLIDQCELLRYRFAILDPEPGVGTAPLTIQGIEDQRKKFDTKYAAFYYPRVIISDPVTGNSITVPPSGHMAGIYARVDTERGVHKAPANEIIRGILDLETKINKRQQEVLNPPPNNICVLRDFRTEGRGLRVWGARCITSESQWKYINVRRLFIFVEASLDHGTQWVVFEPNDYPLWARVTQSISNFLVTVWRDGALQGKKVEEAFFVRCDRTTMTQDDIDNGRLIILVGIAPVKPAEFVIIRISQFTATANANS